MSLYDYIDADAIDAMRGWLQSLYWEDVDADDIAEFSDTDILYAVEHSYEGGVEAFLRDYELYG